MVFGGGVNDSGHIIYLALIVKKMREQSKCWAVAKTDTQFRATSYLLNGKKCGIGLSLQDIALP
jgi:hypothetical protein